MRVIVFFDLPMGSMSEKRIYIKFRRFLIKNGFLMIQESVYSKLALNGSAVKNVINNLYKNKPESCLVQVLTVTEKQYSKMEFISGDYKTDVLNDDRRLVII